VKEILWSSVVSPLRSPQSLRAPHIFSSAEPHAALILATVHRAFRGTLSGIRSRKPMLGSDQFGGTFRTPPYCASEQSVDCLRAGRIAALLTALLPGPPRTRANVVCRPDVVADYEFDVFEFRDSRRDWTVEGLRIEHRADEGEQVRVPCIVDPISASSAGDHPRSYYLVDHNGNPQTPCAA
jgi:hypothetical protein